MSTTAAATTATTTIQTNHIAPYSETNKKGEKKIESG